MIKNEEIINEKENNNKNENHIDEMNSGEVEVEEKGN